MFGFPLLLIPLAVCNIIVFLMRDVGFDGQLFQLPVPSGAIWKVTLGESLLALALLLLLLEVQKSARPGGKYLTDHLLSLLIFGGAAAEFLLLPPFANSTFFLLALVAMVDFLSGIALRGRRPKRVRDVIAPEPVPQPVVVAAPAMAREPIVRAPLRSREPIVPDEPMVPQGAAQHEAVRADQTHAVTTSPDRMPADSFEATHATSDQTTPPRVEPIINMDPVLGDPKDDPSPESKSPPRAPT